MSRTRRESSKKGVLYPLTKLLLLRGLITRVAHRPATLHDPRLESGERPTDAALRDAEAENRGAVDGVLLRVANQFESDGPRPRDGYERETTLVEDRLRRGILVLRRSVEDRIVRAVVLAARVMMGSNDKV